MAPLKFPRGLYLAIYLPSDWLRALSTLPREDWDAGERQEDGDAGSLRTPRVELPSPLSALRLSFGLGRGIP